MAETSILVPVRYPLKEPCVRTVTCARDIASQKDDSFLYVLHVNLIQRRESVTREALKRDVEARVGPLRRASYHVRHSYLIEETILDEIVHQDIDYVVLATAKGGRLRRRLRKLLDIGPDLETYLERQVDVKIITAS